MAPMALGHVEITPGVCGGKPHIAGHRVSVQNIAIWHERLGLEPDEIATTYGLTLGEVYAALAYYPTIAPRLTSPSPRTNPL